MTQDHTGTQALAREVGSANANANATADHGRQENDDLVELALAAMPPGMQRKREMSTDELLREMSRVPLFMTSIDDESEADNAMLDAIKALAYEGTKTEVAGNFRQQGNEAAQAKRWSDARQFYTKAIATLRDQGNTATTTTTTTMTTTPPPPPTIGDASSSEHADKQAEVEAKEAQSIEEACLANRALCNLEMKNYRSCASDCAAALRLNSGNVKAWYRAAAAYLATDRIPEALDACTGGLRHAADNGFLLSLQARVRERGDCLVRLEQVRRGRAAKLDRDRATIQQALSQRNITTRWTDAPPDLDDAAITLADPSDARSVLSLPVLLLYPLHAQTDLVKSCREDESLAHHLAYILPLPWDERAEYCLGQVDCYLETVSGGLIKAGKKLSLLSLVSNAKVEIVDGLVRIFVVPKGRASDWIAQFKIRKGKR